MKAIDLPNMEPPSDSIYDDLEIWKVTITWNGDEYDVKYIPYVGYDSHLMLDDFKRKFFNDIMLEVGYPFPEIDDTYVYSRWSKNALLMVIGEEAKDTIDLVSSIPFYFFGKFPDHFGGYYKKNITDWLKDNQRRWLKIESMSFCKVPEEEQKKIRSFMEEERAISKAINEGRL